MVRRRMHTDFASRVRAPQESKQSLSKSANGSAALNSAKAVRSRLVGGQGPVSVRAVPTPISISTNAIDKTRDKMRQLSEREIEAANEKTTVMARRYGNNFFF